MSNLKLHNKDKDEELQVSFSRLGAMVDNRVNIYHLKIEDIAWWVSAMLEKLIVHPQPFFVLVSSYSKVVGNEFTNQVFKIRQAGGDVFIRCNASSEESLNRAVTLNGKEGVKLWLDMMEGVWSVEVLNKMVNLGVVSAVCCDKEKQLKGIDTTKVKYFIYK